MAIVGKINNDLLICFWDIEITKKIVSNNDSSSFFIEYIIHPKYIKGLICYE